MSQSLNHFKFVRVYMILMNDDSFIKLNGKIIDIPESVPETEICEAGQDPSQDPRTAGISLAPLIYQYQWLC